MAVKLADAVAYLRADTSQLDSDLNDAEGKIAAGGSRFGSVLQGIGISVGMGLANIAVEAVGRITAFMGESVGAASNMQETLSRTNVLFGESADQLVSWASSTAIAIGQSQQQALDAATTFATFGRAAGLANDDLVAFSTGFTELASDLASFNNTTPEDAIQAIGAALRGEAEPMRRYGVLLDDATLKAKAMELGIYDGTGALTQQQRVLAAQAAIYEQTSAAQGDFTRTSGGLANQQRILDAQMENLKATVGEALLPVMLSLTGALNELAQQVLPPLTDFIRNQVVPAMTAIGEVMTAYVIPVLAIIGDAFRNFGSTLEQQRNGPLAYLVQWFEQNLPRIQQIVSTVLSAIQTFWNQHGQTIMEWVGAFLGVVASIWNTTFRNILDTVQIILQLLTGDIDGALGTVAGIFRRNGDLYQEIMRGTIENVRRMFTDPDWAALGTAIVEGVARGLLGAAWIPMEAARRVAQDAVDAARRALGIGSPSRVAGEEIGVPFAEGIGVGLQQALGNLSGSITSGMAGLVAGAGGGLGPVQPVAVTLNIYGGDAATVGGAARIGILSGLRAAGLR